MYTGNKLKEKYYSQGRIFFIIKDKSEIEQKNVLTEIS